MSDTEGSPSSKEAARTALFSLIARTADATKDPSPQTAAEALLNLAEAFAYAVPPGQPH
ncbi:MULTISPECIES: hypothetical protein [Streptomyces]|uniref:hypothetical protein n=1 Tax=Streptomyces TaxID=1883 RepID=UPI00017E9A2A|nr:MULTISPECIES: hypothetical protein [Streptomyces]EDX21352.1 hypothetical protein SSAG_01143 [Streptomyces sp. Mg1]RPK32019.1 hypothetical protein EES37_34335 [Streptomyces sp. ADI91-18]WBY18179.1 hypothetical protein PET44_00205 [Streptomyces goshikiensis]WSR96688.1 hypothetical protein OG224_00495 [Streptomyces goshikiensis]WSS02921.1 hypothetical protein OG224_35320 [Streptomyces goshikiensis]